MRLEVRHASRYRYQRPAVFSQHLLRLTPCAVPGQTVARTALSIIPEPDAIDSHRDMFGNTVHVATVSRPHGELEIVATSLIERAARPAPDLAASAPWEEVRALATGAAGPPPGAEVSLYAFPSRMTVPDRAIQAYAEESFAPGRPVLEGASDLCRRIHLDFEYAPGVTFADTPPAESFAARRGVCQDFAHVMLAGLRALRLPARYVSGYLRTIPPEGKPRLEGADASHAWVSVWEPSLGWIDFDPTNDCMPGEEHVELALGRDYDDVSPISGLVVGAGKQDLDVGVDVVEAPA